jgi:hypothetical protein
LNGGIVEMPFGERYCNRCDRPLHENHSECRPWAADYVIVVHEGYGCDTGCCGHRVYAMTNKGHEVDSEFEFSHPYGEDYNDFARNLAAARFPDLPLRYEEYDISDY